MKNEEIISATFGLLAILSVGFFGLLAGRWNEDNAITLCYFCHLRWSHQQPLEFVEWLKETYPHYYEGALEVRRTTVKNQNLEELYKYYQSKL